jgi:HD-GYP domain-containing protein (c-di-GMP phosphodiesterase class II)
VRHHHEHFDGRGYPNGKKGEDIPLGSRILAVADAYDAMTSDRPYRSAMSKETAIARLKAASGTQFDPQVVEAFLTALAKEEEREYMPHRAQPRVEEASSETGER